MINWLWLLPAFVAGLFTAWGLLLLLIWLAGKE